MRSVPAWHRAWHGSISPVLVWVVRSSSFSSSSRPPRRLPRLLCAPTPRSRPPMPRFPAPVRPPAHPSPTGIRRTRCQAWSTTSTCHRHDVVPLPSTRQTPSERIFSPAFSVPVPAGRGGGGGDGVPQSRLTWVAEGMARWAWYARLSANVADTQGRPLDADMRARTAREKAAGSMDVPGFGAHGGMRRTSTAYPPWENINTTCCNAEMLSHAKEKLAHHNGR
mmetsp:Transcript_10479/g.64126  ORF Transcript_10479/g.64126 Transcript_10479/m.64126 type:complete len:223 (+) Transcript_10479:412-1080(+)